MILLGNNNPNLNENHEKMNGSDYLLILTKIEELAIQFGRMEKKFDHSIGADIYKIFSPKKVADKNGASYATVLEWIKDGKFIPIAGTKYRITGIEIKRFIEDSSKYSLN